MQHSDVLIVGGGPAGLATAVALRASGHVVTLLEPSDYSAVRVGEHLDPTALPILHKFALPSQVWREQSLACPGVCSYWGDAVATASSTLFQPFGMGLILSRPAFDQRFAQAARVNGIHWQQGQVSSVKQDNKRIWQVAIRHDKKEIETCIAARVLADASGRGAHLAHMLGAQIIAYDRLIGIAAYLPGSQASQAGQATDYPLHIESMPNGWWYAAPLFDGRRIATFMTDADLLSGTPANDWQHNFVQSHALAHALAGEPLPDMETATFTVRNARSQRLDKVADTGWLAVGDAATAYDPLASAGIRKGLQQGLLAAEAIAQYLNGHEPAITSWADQVQALFDDYLLERAKYYRMETRWSSSPFWQRRHAALPMETPVKPDSAQSSAVLGSASATLLAPLGEAHPGIDLRVLCTLVEPNQTMGDLALRYQSLVNSRFLDLDIIVALQHLSQAVLAEQGENR